MDSNKMIEELINSIGAISEVLGLFYVNLIKQGFDAYQAMFLTSEFMKALMPNGNSE